MRTGTGSASRAAGAAEASVEERISCIWEGAWIKGLLGCKKSGWETEGERGGDFGVLVR